MYDDEFVAVGGERNEFGKVAGIGFGFFFSFLGGRDLINVTKIIYLLSRLVCFYLKLHLFFDNLVL